MGSRYEPAELNGVCHFIEHLLFKGTKKRSAKEISQAVEGIGGYLNAFTSEEATCFHAKAAHERFEELLDVLMDMFLESRTRVEHAQNAYLGGQQQIFSTIEQAFGEPSDTGLQSQLADFWGSWHDLANRPGDPASRTQLMQRAGTVASTLRGMHGTLASLYTGYLTAAQLAAIGALDGTEEDLALAGLVFAGARPWLGDNL